MINIFKNFFKIDKEKYSVPKSVQDAIPVKCIWNDGIFMVEKNKYSKTYKFSDINYAVSNKEDKERMFLKYSEILNSLDSGATSKLSIVNRRINEIKFEKSMLLKEADDKLNEYRKDYNDMLLNEATSSNGMIQEKYITITIEKLNIDEARNYFNRVGSDLISKFKELGSKCEEMNTEERMRLYYDFYRQGEETSFHFDIKENMKKGHSFKDYISPNSLELKKDYFKMGEKFGRVLYLKEYANYIKDDMVAELTELNKNMILNIDINPVPMDKAIAQAERKALNVETNIANWQRSQNNNNNYSAVIPYDLEQQRQETKEFLNDLVTRDQRMFLCVVTLVHTADSKEELDNDTESIISTATKYSCQLAILKIQQLEGLQTTIPFGVSKIDILRTLTTESLAVFMPFRVQEVQHESGIFYGRNAISKNIITINRKELLNANSFILGVSGSGKSFTAKEEISSIIMQETNADVIIIDPEREYSPLIKALGGEVVKISATSENHINALDMNKEYGDIENPIILKSQFILSLYEQLTGKEIEMEQKSIIDRCVSIVYKEYKNNNYQGKAPTLKEFRKILLQQPETEAKNIALNLELFTEGSLNTFANETNVDTNNRLLCYDILDLGKQLLPVGMLVILDSILNRITKNRSENRRTYIYIDEIYLLFKYEYSADFLATLWKRVRKYGAAATGITQNVEELLRSDKARLMLANSEFIVMLNQASTDKAELAKLLNISEEQLGFITNVGVGQGLIKVGNNLIPFINKFPTNSKLYKLMTTKVGEMIN